MRITRQIALLFLSLAAVATVLVACGSGDSDTESFVGSAADESQAPVVRAGETFTVDQFEAAGFKLSREFDTETVPLAENIYYGFSEQRDIEIRKYATHDDANSAGVEAALSAIGRSPNSNSGGGIITSTGNRTSYHAYMVAGNMVLLCQTDLSACENLVNAIP
ncbi:MAG: hypothetical protein QF357_06690 [Dehalococcoidia bacterium]|jgi:hypothetical protein|nr:hypothetical protein [Dehalococcoidia bacterium]